VIRYAMYVIAAAVALVLQITWLDRVTPGAPVDPFLVIVMTVGLLHGPEEGALVGAGVGLLEDVMTGAPLGLGMLSALVVGFCAGLGERSMYVENIWLPAVAAAVLTCVRNVVWVGAAHLVGLLNTPVLDVARVTVLAACYNGVIAVPLFHGLRRLDEALVRLYERARTL
jgi:rod shape-determining protein MreD